MAETNQNVTILLDRLYNLKGEDNVLIRETEERIEAALQRIANIEATIAGAEQEQTEQEQGLRAFQQQKSLFETAFEGLTDETFSALSRIDVNLEIGTLMAQVQEKSPAFIEGLINTIEGIKRDIVGYNEELGRANEELSKLRVQLDVHIEQRAQLVSLLEQSLSTEEIERESLTTNFVKRVLTSFGVFTTDEIAKLTKMIIFPEDGLYEYDRGYEERVTKGLIGFVDEENSPVDMELNSGEGGPISTDEEVGLDSKRVTDDDEVTLDPPVVIEEDEELLDSKLTTDDDEITLDQPVVTDEDTSLDAPAVTDEEGKKKDDTFEGPPVVLNFQQFQEADLDKIVSGKIPVALDAETDEEEVDLDSKLTTDDDEVTLDPPVVTEEEVVEEKEDEEDLTHVKEFLSRIGLKIDNFEKVNSEKTTNILKAIAEADEELVERNYEILRSINLDDEAYKMRSGHMYITDVDFSKKITLLRAKNISEQKIQSMIKDTNSGLRVSFADIEKRIQSVENLHGKIDESNIYLICKDVSMYEENVDTLLRYGIDIDDKESRNHSVVLFESLNIPSNVEILKNYIISILKSNGKYALSVFWKKPEELLKDIDDLIEAGLENVIATHPEVLGMQTSSLIRRVKYCEANGKPVFTDDMRSEPCDYIMRADLFRKEFNYPTDLPELANSKQTNDSLVDVIGNSDYIEILLNTLDEYYAKTESFATPEVVESMSEHFEEISHYLEDNAKAELVGKYTYKVDGVCICKTKLERNIAIILNALAAAKQPTLGVEREIVLVSALYNSGLSVDDLKKVAGSCLGFNQAAQEVKL